MKTYYGIKQTMTQTFDKAGKRLPVTVVSVKPMKVTQVKQNDRDGYEALQVGVGERRVKTISKPLRTHLKVAEGDKAPRYVRELRGVSGESEGMTEIKITDVFKVGDRVAVAGVSKGRGFAGVIKRWGFAGGPKTHGQSDRQRAPGSIGQGTDPGRVHKGKKMPGRFGNQRFKIQNLLVIKIDEAAEELWLSGPVPGARGALLEIKKTGEVSFAGLFDAEKEVTEAVEKTEEVATEVKAEKTAEVNTTEEEEGKEETKAEAKKEEEGEAAKVETNETEKEEKDEKVEK